MAIPMETAREGSGGNEPHEPRSMTLADIMVIVAGVGITLVVHPVSAFPPPFAPISAWFIVAALFAWFLWGVELATSLVILMRQGIYNRPARPAEWLAILVALLLAQRAIPNLDTVMDWTFRREWLSHSFGLCRWIVGGLGMVVVLVGIVAMVLMRRVMPHWAKTLVLATLALVLLWGPLDVFSREAPSLLPSWTEEYPGWLFWAYLEGRQYAAMLPEGLLFGIPATEALLERVRPGSRRWIWTEWLGLGTALLLGSFWIASLYLFRSEWPPDSLNVERAVVPVWVAGVSGSAG